MFDQGSVLPEAVADSHRSLGEATALMASGASRWRFLAPIVIVAFVALAFMPALDAGLVDWDDDDLLIHNVNYRSLSAQSLRWMFSTSLAGHFQPLTWLSYTLDWTLWGRETFGYHLTNVVLHALTAVAFYFLARRLLVAAAGRIGASSLRTVGCATFAALVFAVHPLRVESVAWLAERRDVLSGLFYVLSVTAYLRWATGRDGRGSRFYVVSILLCAVSLLAKASAVTLPFVLLILDAYPLRRFRRRRVLLEKLPFLALALAGGVRAVIAQGEGGALYGLAGHDIPARLAQACYGLTFYLKKTLWPADLGPLYEIPAREVLFGSMLWINAAGVLAVAVAALALRRRLSALTAALAVYVVVVFPVLGFVQSGPQLVADRYSYLSCMGFAVLAGGGLNKLFGSRNDAGNATRRALIALASMMIVVVLAQATFRQSDHWLSPLTLWVRGVAVSPSSSIAHANLADACMGVGDYAAAVHHYRLALQLNPRDVVALHRYADLQRRFGERDEAIRYYLRTLQIDPGRHAACLSLARLFVEAGKPHDAVRTLRDGITRAETGTVGAREMAEDLARLLATHPRSEDRPQPAPSYAGDRVDGRENVR